MDKHQHNCSFVVIYMKETDWQERNKWYPTNYTLKISFCCSFRLLTAAHTALLYLPEIQTGSEPLNASSTFNSIFCWLCRIKLFLEMTEPLVHASVILCGCISRIIPDLLSFIFFHLHFWLCSYLQDCHLMPSISCLKMSHIWELFSATDLSRFDNFETSLPVITNNHVS